MPLWHKASAVEVALCWAVRMTHQRSTESLAREVTRDRSASASRDQIVEPGKPELNAEAEARRAVTGRCGSRFERCGAVRRQPG